MKFLVDERYLEEVVLYSLRCSCEDCVHYDAPTGKCSLGWPNEMHTRKALCEGSWGEILFCKDFDMN